MDELKIENEGLTSENAQLKQTVENLNLTLQNLNAEKAGLSGQVLSLQDDKRKLEAQIANAKANSETDGLVIKNLQAQIDTMNMVRAAMTGNK